MMQGPVYSLLFDQSLISKLGATSCYWLWWRREEQEAAIKTKRLSANIFLYPTFLITAVSSVPSSAQRAVRWWQRSSLVTTDRWRLIGNQSQSAWLLRLQKCVLNVNLSLWKITNSSNYRGGSLNLKCPGHRSDLPHPEALFSEITGTFIEAAVVLL